MIDLTPVQKQAVYWPLIEMIRKIERLEAKVAELQESKADRRGPKKK